MILYDKYSTIECLLLFLLNSRALNIGAASPRHENPEHVALSPVIYAEKTPPLCRRENLEKQRLDSVDKLLSRTIGCIRPLIIRAELNTMGLHDAAVKITANCCGASSA